MVLTICGLSVSCKTFPVSTAASSSASDASTAPSTMFSMSACTSSAVSHITGDDCILTVRRKQILFRITTVLPLNKPGGREVDLVVKRYLKLREAPRSSTHTPTNGAPAGFFSGSSSGAGVPELSLLHAELEAQRGDIDRIDSAGFKVISGLDDAVNRVEGDLGKMRDSLAGLREELRGNHDDMASLKSEIKEVKKQSQDRTIVKSLEEQLHSANDAMQTIRQGLHDLAAKFEGEFESVNVGLRQRAKEIEELKSLLKDRVPAREHAKDMASVRGELAKLRKQLDDKNVKQPDPFPSRELDILTSNIAKIGNRASLVESLQMEFEIFKGRVERMEAASQASQARQAPLSLPTAETRSAYDRYDDHNYHQPELRSSHRKRPSGLDTSPLPDSNSKRAATSSDLADAITATRWSENTPSSPAAETTTRSVATRQAKAGKLDTRAPRPGRRSLVDVSVGDKAHQAKRKG